VNPALEIGSKLALTLASLYVPGAGPAVTGLAAVFEAVKQFQSTNGRDPAYVPTREELDAFIAERESKRIVG
jgi:hypothetical protein